MTFSLDDIRQMDRDDPLAELRQAFHVPPHGDGEQTYLCGNSLGLQPRGAQRYLQTELDRWRDHAVEGHFEGDPAWTRYQDLLKTPMAALVGAAPEEVTVMNTLTVNLHLLMASFYRPRGARRQIVIERHAFPSDRYAAASQLRWHGLNPDQCLVEIGADAAGALVDEGELEEYLQAEGERVALVLWPGVQYATGQRFDLRRITRAAHACGAVAGFDLAHSAGNVPLALHDDGADFAAWCTYKYLNGGPGAIAAAFVHQRHLDREDLPRLEGWWGVGLEHRFLMEPGFRAAAGADAWQLSTPPTLAMAPLRASLELFEQAGMPALREKSLRLTGILEQLLEARAAHLFEVLTPRDSARRGCQLSLRVRQGREAGRKLFGELVAAGIIGDWREPDIIRVAPVPMYNRYADAWTFIERACELLD